MIGSSTGVAAMGTMTPRGRTWTFDNLTGWKQMPRAIRWALLGLLVVTVACGDGGETASRPTTTSTTVDPDVSYRGTIQGAFTELYPEFEDDYDRSRSAWAAFLGIIEGLNPPAGAEVAHARMVAEFDQLVAAMAGASDTCDRTPGPGGPCFAAVSEAEDTRRAAIEAIYEATGMDYDELFRDINR